MNNRYKYILAIFVFMIAGCFMLKETTLSMSREVSTDNPILLDGYYSFNYEAGNRIYFLYENGIVLYGSSPSESELSKTEESYKDGTYYKRVKDLQYHWGVYKIEDDEIQLNMWSPSDWPYQTFLKKGKVLNDRSFKLETADWSTTKGIEEINEHYEFRALTPKPDSTNMFIK